MFYLLVDKLRRARKKSLYNTNKHADRYAATIFKDVSLFYRVFHEDCRSAEYPSTSLMERTTFDELTPAMFVLPFMSIPSFSSHQCWRVKRV